MTVRVRPISIPADLDAIASLSFGLGEVAWTERDLWVCFGAHRGYGLLTLSTRLDEENRIVEAAPLGFAICLPVAPDGCRIIDMAIHEDVRRKGLGLGMMAVLMLSLRRAGKLSVDVVVSERSLAAQRFFRACDFRATQVLRGLFRDGSVDGIHFEYPLQREGDLAGVAAADVKEAR